MKLSQYRGKDRQKILGVYILIIIAIIVAALIILKTAVPKIQTNIAARQEQQAEENSRMAEEVDGLIGQIGEVTLDSEAAILAARDAYDNLNAKQKGLVTDLDILTNAESSYAELLQAQQESEAAAEQQETVEENNMAEEEEENASDYIIPDSDSRYLDKSELAGLSKEQLRLARNEIYARHGRKFDDQGLQDYFNSKSWYIPSVDASSFTESMLNDYEVKNAYLISDYEEEMGYK